MRALVVAAHPLSAVVGRRQVDVTVAALGRAGHEVQLADLHADGFQPVMGLEEWRAYRRHEPLLDDQTRPYVDALRRADMLVFVYPSVWLGVPSLLKGFLERVFVPGVAFHFDPDAGRVKPGLHHVRHLVAVTTHPASRLRVTVLGDAGRRTLLRTLRLGCGRRCRSTWLALYDGGRRTPDELAAFEARIEAALGRPRPVPTAMRVPRRRARAAEAVRPA